MNFKSDFLELIRNPSLCYQKGLFFFRLASNSNYTKINFGSFS